MDEKKQWLFSYGTLQDPEMQRILFGFCCPYKKAELKGWSLYASGEDGYLFIKPDPAGTVSGRIIELDRRALHEADRWEETPYYKRERADVSLEDGSMREVWVYTRRDAQGELYAGSGLSLLDREIVLDVLKNLRQEDDKQCMPIHPG